jgi:hypothetical protein
MARTKGSKNKTGAEVKAQILATYERLGGLANFASWAKEHQSEFYRMFAQLAPKEVDATVVYVDETTLTDDELADIASGRSPAAVEPTPGETEPSPVH